jgi:hypothetical protein
MMAALVSGRHRVVEDVAVILSITQCPNLSHTQPHCEEAVAPAVEAQRWWIPVMKWASKGDRIFAGIGVGDPLDPG